MLSMPEIGPEHPLTYRQEIVAPFFRLVLARESCAIVGPASMGKSRLRDFILRLDVQQHYLGDQAPFTLLVRADCNRLAEVSDWGLYELLLTALIESSGRHPDLQLLRPELSDLRHKAIISRDALLARRHVELAAHMICQERRVQLCIILDEFDASYRNLPAPALANLRALRDANKYTLCYALILREDPARLRPPTDCEGFYELFSRSVLGLGPYEATDAERVLQQLEARKSRTLSEHARSQLLRLSGGHPGLIVGLFDALIDDGAPGENEWDHWALAQSVVQEECRKLWLGLAGDERLALSHLAQGLGASDDVRRVLALKGIIRLKEGQEVLFSPVFAHYVLAQGTPISKPLWVDEQAGVVWVEGRFIKDLAPLEFDLLAFLYRHVGQICSRDQILDSLYPRESKTSKGGLQDNRVDTLVKRVRQRVEPVRQHPRYILTVRGKGYKLVDSPESSTR